MAIKTCSWCHQTVEVDDDVWGVVVEGSRSHYISRPGPPRKEEQEGDDLTDDLAAEPEVPIESIPSVPSPAPRERRPRKQSAPTWSRDDAPKVDVMQIVRLRKAREKERAARKAARLSVEQIQEMNLFPASES
jgi:hypothetical protein